MSRRLFPAIAVVLVGLAWPTSAQAPATPAAPTPHPFFQDARVSSVSLTFTPQEFAALAPRRVPRGGSSQSWLQGAEGRRNGLSASRGLEFPYVHASAIIDGRPVADIGVRYKGNGTFILGQQVGKISLKLDLNHFIKGQTLAGLKMLNLHSNVTDASSMNEPLAFRLFRAAGVPAPRTAYVKVFITVPGQYATAYYGLFTLVEAPDEPFAAARGLPKAGAIFKPVTTSLFADLGRDWTRYKQTYDPKTPLAPQQQQRVIDCAAFVSHSTDAAFAKGIGDCVDLDNAARFLAVTVWLSDLDGILGSGQNYYLYLDPRTNRFSFVAWDQDHSFGQFFRGSQTQREQLSIVHPWSNENRFLERLFAVDAFRTRYRAALADLGRTLCVPARLSEQVDTLAVLIRPAVQAESSARLTHFDMAVAGRTPPSDDFMFRGATVPIKPFMQARAASVAQQLAQQ
jgi:spore coat protein H